MNLKESFETYKSLYGDAFLKELELEDSIKAEVEHNIQKALDTKRKDNQAGESQLSTRLMSSEWHGVRENINVLIKNVQNPTQKVQGLYREPMEVLLSVYKKDLGALSDLLTLTGLSDLLSFGMGLENQEKPMAISNMALKIGTDVEGEADLYNYAKNLKAMNSNMDEKNLFKGLNQRVGISYKKAYLSATMKKDKYAQIKWSKEWRTALGAKVIECLMPTGLFEMCKVSYVDGKGKTKEIQSLTCSEWLKATWFSNESKIVHNAVKYPPMICPPKKWAEGQLGGYYGACSLHTNLVRVKDYEVHSQVLKTYAKKLQMIDLSKVYKALNAMQETPFVINSFILKVLEEIVATGGDMCGVPRFEPLDIPPKKSDEEWNKMSKAEQKKYREWLSGLYAMERSRFGHALRFSMELKEAQRFAKYPKIYFPWNIDYRGRMYPIATILSPQGDDIGKSLLLFADAKEIKAEDVKWMEIHGANLAGHDKVNFAERQMWVQKHTTDIIASAEDPLGYTWWYEESKGDYPLEFLSFCNEYKKLKEWEKTHGTADGFKTQLPLAFDGTCSGLQHFSGLLRDEVGSYAVNLVPSDKVQDIYGIVAEKVNKVLLFDAKCGMGNEVKRDKKTGEVLKDSTGKPKIKYGTKDMAQWWVIFNRMKFGQDGITRKVCKRSVMTLAYGSKQYGFKENLLEDIIKPFIAEHKDDNPFINKTQAAVYMAGLIWDAVQTTVVKAVEGMNWLQKVAQLITKNGNVISWVTPNNLLVQQNYMKVEKKVSKLRFNGARVRFYTADETQQVDERAQMQGISPNFIHSMDATHMQRVVGRERDLGNTNFMMIHDSFGTDASRAGELYKVVREEFVKMYKDHNYLQDFLDSVSYMIAEEDKDKIPPIPSFGTLNLDDVINSQFCFA